MSTKWSSHTFMAIIRKLAVQRDLAIFSHTENILILRFWMQFFTDFNINLICNHVIQCYLIICFQVCVDLKYCSNNWTISIWKSMKFGNFKWKKLFRGFKFAWKFNFTFNFIVYMYSSKDLMKILYITLQYWAQISRNWVRMD